MNAGVHEHDEHPVRLVVEDDLVRSRLTVFLRILLAIPHLVWLALWTIGVFFAAIANWVATLVAGTPPAALHRFMSAYVRYTLHLNAYLYLVANPYPGFVGEEGEYPVDLRLPAPGLQPRWKTLLRILLALPALFLAATLGGAGTGAGFASRRNRARYSSGGPGALAGLCAFLGWFASLARGRMPKGLRDAGAYGIGYSAQALAYVLLVTDRYPSADPAAMLEGVERPPQHAVYLVGDAHDLRRSRLTVFFRLLLAVPHLVWLVLWGIAAALAAIANWFATLITGTPPAALHRFLSRYVRYELHVTAFLYLAANPFPGFLGESGTYPLDLVLPGPARQSRRRTGFRIFLAIPAMLVNAALGWALAVAALLTWFVALARGAAPWGLRNLMAYSLRYSAQLNAYLFLVTDAYPHASPLEGAEPSQLSFDEAL
jgi:hypothetical protein